MSEPTTQQRWRSWLMERNRRGTRVVSWCALSLYPIFGILDWKIAPRSALPVLVGTRVFFCLLTLVLLQLVKTRVFERHPDLISSIYMVLGASTISVMTVLMGGLASTYYAGLCLVIVAAGLLFVWPARVVLFTHAMILVSFTAPNLLLGNVGNPISAGSNLAFLIAIALVTAIGQLVLFGAQHKQFIDRIALEETKASLELAHNQLKQLDSFKSELFANITHEFKTPLAMVLAPLELMLQGETGELTPAQEATFQSMFRAGLKLLKMIGDLLDLSKLEDSKLRLKVAENDLCAHVA